MKYKTTNFSKAKKFAKRSKQYIVFFLLLSMVLMGTWCAPPKWAEKVVQELKDKYLIEMMVEKDV